MNTDDRPDAGVHPVSGEGHAYVRIRRSGFSLGEILVVMVVMGLLGYLMIPNLEIVRYRMDGAARGYSAALVTAQRAAVQRQHDVAVIFDVPRSRLMIHEDGDNDGVFDPGERLRAVPLGEGVRFGVGSAPYMSASHDAAVTFTQTTADGSPVVRFQRTGSASEHGVIYLTSDRSIRGARYAKDTRSLEVNRATGRVTWHYYDSTEWKQGF